MATTGNVKWNHAKQQTNRYRDNNNFPIRLATEGRKGQNPPENVNVNKNINKNIKNENKNKCKMINRDENKTSTLNICSLNVRTLLDKSRIEELDMALKDINWDIIGLAETRLEGEEIMERKDGSLFCFKGQTKGLYGVGLLIHERLKGFINTIKLYNERVIAVKLKLKSTTLTIVQVYAPTQASTEQDIEEFFEDISLAIKELKSEIMIVMGDFNAKVGKKRYGEEAVLGPFGYGERNERGENLITWIWQEGFCVGNTLFKKKEKNQWSWLSPDARTKNLIDFILINKRTVLTDVSIIKNFKFESDHRLLRAKLRINHKTRKIVNNTKKVLPRLIADDRKIEYNSELNMQISTNHKEKIDSQLHYNHLQYCIKTCADRYLNAITSKKEEKVSINTKNLIIEKQRLQNKQNKTNDDYTSLRKMKKQVKENIKKDVEKYDEEVIKQILTSTGSFKKVKDHLSAGKQWIPSLTRNKNEQFARKEILQIATDFYKDLYTSKTSNNSSNLETEILYCQPDPVLPFTVAEIRQSISELSSDKCVDGDGIKAEYLKYGIDTVLEEIKILFNNVLEKETFPKQWLSSSITLLYKKGDKKDIGNYRPISIISVIYKVFSKCISRRMIMSLNFNQPKEQAGFRSGYSTMDHLHTINQIIEKTSEYKIPLYLAFIDFKKAFDSIEHWAIWEALHNQGIQEKYINLLRKLYDKSYAYVKLEKNGPIFKLGRGVRQGDPISPQLFAAVLEDRFRQLNWSKYGVTICGEKLNNLRFADDIILLSNSPTELQQMLNDLNKKCNEAGLEINMSKTVVMTNADKIRITINNEALEYVEDFCYLGQIISFNNRMEKEINRRITNAWKQFWNLRRLIKVNLSNELIKYIFDTGVLPVLTYGAQTWALTRKLKNKLQICQRSMERSILGISRIQRIRSSTIRSRTKIIDVIHKAACLKWSWAGHIMRVTDDRWTKLATEWCPIHLTRDVGRQKLRWRDDLTGYCKEWMTTAYDRNKWRELEEAYVRYNQT